MAALQYSSLDSAKRQVRLLKLKYRTFSTARTCNISCELEIVSLNDNPTYVALSYTWGNAINDRPILVDGIKTMVKPNLEAALHHLQQESKTLRLWVDALCINQGDEPEKTEQVRQMLQIYQSAALTIIWLGLAADDSERLLDSLDRFGRELVQKGALRVLWPTPMNETARHSDIKRYLQEVVEEIASGAFDIPFPVAAFKSLLFREWWGRVWVLQELCVSSKIKFACGSKTVNGQRFLAVMLFYLYLEKQLSSLPQTRSTSLTSSTAYAMIGLRYKFQSRPPYRDETLLQLLERAYVSYYSPPLATSEDRDRIFGLLGLASDTEKLGLEANYSKPCRTIYVETARTLLVNGHMDVLCLCQLPQRGSDLPSWVPDWRAPIRRPCGDYVEASLFHASGNSAASVFFDATQGFDDHIYIRGAQVDVVTVFGSEWVPDYTFDKEFDLKAAGILLKEVEELCRHSSAVYEDVCRRTALWKDATWRVPIADQELVNLGSRQRATGASYQGYVLLTKAANSAESLGNEPNSAAKSYMNAMTTLHGRRPFVSAKGYVGLGPAHLCKGDVICILLGAHVPFILRKSPDERYQLVGEAYVHGIMDGEFIATSPKIVRFEFGSTPIC